MERKLLVKMSDFAMPWNGVHMCIVYIYFLHCGKVARLL
jgi:hypothetical protein